MGEHDRFDLGLLLSGLFTLVTILGQWPILLQIRHGSTLGSWRLPVLPRPNLPQPVPRDLVPPLEDDFLVSESRAESDFAAEPNWETRATIAFGRLVKHLQLIDTLSNSSIVTCFWLIRHVHTQSEIGT